MANNLQRIIDADFEIVGGPYRLGEEHRRERGWYFTGRHDADGDPYFMRHPRWWRRRRMLRLAPIIALGVFAACILVLSLGVAVGEKFGWIVRAPQRDDAPGTTKAAIAEAVRRGLIADPNPSRSR